ncbi:UNKNOWN [Stylonychia lemnae]|uniref:Phosphoglycerate mutase family protein n=1 Tax=Stylonychia lemnae TaxID=5949 RepID=A0A078AKZ0_STYLE|nr:UNKNOWN [Stylonychia lemnae]|eukprot:CDW83035.1 UNKNOWN [Stylonychia lemnae]
MENKGGSQIYLIRHGERADQVINPSRKIEFENDTHLTEEGMNQANQTGQYLRKTIEYERQENRPFDQVIIESSPFLRCLQTASCIAQQIDIKEIKVNFGFREWVPSYIENPLGLLYIDLKTKDDLSKEVGGLRVLIPENYQNDKVSAIKDLKFPETMDEASDRCKYLTQDLIDIYKKSSDQRVMHIIVSHRLLVQEFGIQNGGNNYRFQYCSVSAIEIQQGDQGTRLLVDNEIFYEVDKVDSDEDEFEDDNQNIDGNLV